MPTGEAVHFTGGAEVNGDGRGSVSTRAARIALI